MPEGIAGLSLKWLRCALQESTGSLRGLVRQLSIDQFENEGRRVMGAESAAKAAGEGRTPMFERHSMDPGSIHKVCPVKQMWDVPECHNQW